MHAPQRLTFGMVSLFALSCAEASEGGTPSLPANEAPTDGAVDQGGAGGTAGANAGEVCPPGQKVVCQCPDGSDGVQVCNEGGSSYGPCEGCGGSGGSGGTSASGGSGGTGGACTPVTYEMLCEDVGVFAKCGFHENCGNPIDCGECPRGLPCGTSYADNYCNCHVSPPPNYSCDTEYPATPIRVGCESDIVPWAGCQLYKNYQSNLWCCPY